MIYIIDLFCGAGGVTEGFERSRHIGNKAAKVIACVNHDAKAIQSHRVNHKKVWHFVEDIRTLEVSPLVSLVNQYRKKDPGCTIIIWASLECTHLSNARGGLSRDGDSRTLCDHMDRYIEAINPDYFWIENVREFRDNGPIRLKCSSSFADRSELAVDSKGKYIFVPDKTRAKEFFNAWVDRIKTFGYHYEDVNLNSADFGAHTKRIRYFAQFAKIGLPIVWPEPTHTKTPMKGSKLKKWKAVSEVLNFESEGNSIFNRKKPLSPKTMARIYAGLIKYIAGGEQAFIQQRQTGLANSKISDINSPSRTLTTTGGNLELVQPQAFLAKYLSNNSKTGINSGADIDNPSPTITAQSRLALIQPGFFQKYYTTGGNLAGLDSPLGTITTKDRDGLVIPQWLDKNYSSQYNHQSLDQPLGAITTKDHYSTVDVKTFGPLEKDLLIRQHWLDKQYSGSHNHQSPDEPLGSITTVNHYSVVETDILSDCRIKQIVGEPLGEHLDAGKNEKHFLINPQYTSKGSSVDSPCFTLIARMDKKAPGIVTIDKCTGNFIIPILSTDCVNTIKVKEFMALYGLCDIKMRMLLVGELKKIQGFPENYYLAGSQENQKRFIGNSVTPVIPKAMAERLTKEFLRSKPTTMLKAA